MKNSFKYIRQDSVTKWEFSISIVELLVSFGVIGFFFRALPPLLPLYNKMPWGYDRLGSRWEFFIPSAIALVFLICNAYLANKFYTQAPIIARILGTAAFLVCLSSIIFTIQVILLIK